MGKGWGEGEERRNSSTLFIPLPFIPSRQGRGNSIFYEIINSDDLVKNLKTRISVIPAKAGIQTKLVRMWGSPFVRRYTRIPLSPRPALSQNPPLHTRSNTRKSRYANIPNFPGHITFSLPDNIGFLTSTDYQSQYGNKKPSFHRLSPLLYSPACLFSSSNSSMKSPD